VTRVQPRRLNPFAIAAVGRARSQRVVGSRVLCVHCHPDPESLVTAALARVRAALDERGADVEVIDLYAHGFDPLLSLEEWAEHGREHEPMGTLAEHARLLRWADTIVFTYPTWYGSQPAMLKGWFDRVLTNGVAYRLEPGRTHIRGKLRNIRRLVVVTSHGSSKSINAIEGEPGKRVITRGVRALCHPLCRTRWIPMYGVDRSTLAERDAWLDRVQRDLTRR